MKEITKYHSRSKAEEYALMSWPQFGKNELSEPFYLGIRSLIGEAKEVVSDPSVCVEVGFGAGRGLYEFRREFPDARIIGIEYSPSMINIARRILEGKKPFHTAREGSRLDVDPRNINYVNGDVQNLDLSDGLADVLLCVNVLDRVGNTRLAMSELIRVTRAKGVLIVISAFDYEDVTTQVDEKISVGQMVDYFAANGCQLIRDNEDTLSKRLYPSGDVKIYNERCLIFQKM